MVDEAQAMRSPEEALALLLGEVRPLPAETVPVGPALAGRVLAEPARAAGDLPPFPSSAMDGYALRAAEAGTPLRLAGRVAAGEDPPPLEPGTSVAIATGAPVPDGADAVVPVELADEVDGAVRIRGAVRVGDHVRRAGSDLPAGSEVLPAGFRLTPLGAASVAAAGLAEASCHRRPRVAVLVTGNELRAPGEPLRRGQIHESNSILVAARCAQLGAEVAAVERVPDDAAATRDAFANALERADLVVSSGGVSVGPHDHVKPALRALSVRELFWRVSTQPGKPVWAGARGSRLVVGLPGNPLSVLVALELFVRPALHALEGAAEPQPPRRRVLLAAPLRRNALRTRVLPVRLRDGRAEPLGADLSHLVARAASADGLVLVPPGEGVAAAGSELVAIPF